MDLKEEKFKESVDGWIKKVAGDLDELKSHNLVRKVSQQDGKINHNYELIMTLKDELEEIWNDVELIKVMLINLRGKEKSGSEL